MSSPVGQIDMKTLQTVEIVATEALVGASREGSWLRLAGSCNQLIISLRLSLPAHNNHLGCFAVCSPHNIYLNHYRNYYIFIITINASYRLH